MPFQIVRNDITKMDVDAIVNAANSSLFGFAGVDGAIHAAAGPELNAECAALHGCNTGDAKITKGYNLPCKYIIHTVGPVWGDGTQGEPELLQRCYRRSLALAKAYQCESVAFPLISSGHFGAPKEICLRIAAETIRAFLLENDMLIYLVIFDRDSFAIGNQLFCGIQSYIDDCCTDRQTSQSEFKNRVSRPDLFKRDDFIGAKAPLLGLEYTCVGASLSRSDEIKDALLHLDESFSEMLLRKIKESGMTDAECYRRANIDRRLFSKIRNDRLYRPEKETVLAFAIALKLSLEETREFLMTAGYALSHSNKFDIIVEYFIRNKIYDIIELNEALFAFDQSLIGQ